MNGSTVISSARTFLQGFTQLPIHFDLKEFRI